MKRLRSLRRSSRSRARRRGTRSASRRSASRSPRAGRSPETVTVNWGDTVTYSNGDSIEHVVRIPRVEVTSPTIPPGGTFEYVFDGGDRELQLRPAGKPQLLRAGRRQGRRLRHAQVGAPRSCSSAKSVTLSGTSAFPGSPVIVRGRDAGAGGSAEAGPRAQRGRGRLVLRPSPAAPRRPLPGPRGRRPARLRHGRHRSFVRRSRSRLDVAPGLEGTRITVTRSVTPSQSADRADLAALRHQAQALGASTTRARCRGAARSCSAHESRRAARSDPGPRASASTSGFTAADSRIVRVRRHEED